MISRSLKQLFYMMAFPSGKKQLLPITGEGDYRDTSNTPTGCVFVLNSESQRSTTSFGSLCVFGVVYICLLWCYLHAEFIYFSALVVAIRDHVGVKCNIHYIKLYLIYYEWGTRSVNIYMTYTVNMREFIFITLTGQKRYLQ